MSALLDSKLCESRNDVSFTGVFSVPKTVWWVVVTLWGFLGSSNGKESACSARDLGLIRGSGWSPGEGNGNPLQYSCLENPMDRGACWAIWGRKGLDTTEKLTLLLTVTLSFLDGWMSEWINAVVPNHFGFRDWFCGRQFFHGVEWGVVSVLPGAHFLLCRLGRGWFLDGGIHIRFPCYPLPKSRVTAMLENWFIFVPCMTEKTARVISPHYLIMIWEF